ncbi:MAG: hypothetical protein A2W05_09770 [Candidatus Schekmanbacteria bacterium RBG_16_38_10]|uniref:Uncharacterized protein n=1 Tax=Candidatus Schekmanbacteria bacterium RBG_16_38_10 TaxID=1817879 RepID=A0A1F7S0V8_9BACT|nr:MAG: hypothetical protein A2W05_09770 [Candidatus Schekmanbacteria bacterium RBG_16_38_10]
MVNVDCKQCGYINNDRDIRIEVIPNRGKYLITGKQEIEIDFYCLECGYLNIFTLSENQPNFNELLDLSDDSFDIYG